MISFSELRLNANILESLLEMGFENPTPIQEKTIPFMLESRKDLVALAQTGTGKTAAFSLPIIEQIDALSVDIQALILCPTRELCLQITRDIKQFSKYNPISTVAVYGGSSISQQIRELRSGCHIVVATPGRAVDLLNRGKLNVSNIQWLVLDEADEMLSMGFQDDLNSILATTPMEKQTLLFSATMPAEIVSISRNYMRKPHEIRVGKQNAGADTISHEYYVVHAKDRYEALKRIADMHPEIYGIIFCRTKVETKEVAEKMARDGYNSDALHGDLSQAQRDWVMQRFRSRQLRILVATDVAARGLDVDNLTHVINFDLPDDPEIYIHRTGRTGRAGRSGTAISIIHMRETGKIRIIEKLSAKKLQRKPVPNGQDVCERQLLNLIERVKNIEVDERQIQPYLDAIDQMLADLPREKLIKHFVSMEFDRFLQYYKNAADLNVAVHEKPEHGRYARVGNEWGGKKNKRNRFRGDFSRFHIPLGRKNNFSVKQLINLINDQPSLRSVEIGKIEIHRDFSSFEIDSRYDKKVIQYMRNIRYKGKPVSVSYSD